MKRYVIERDLPGIGNLQQEQAQSAAQKSNSVLAELGPNIQWVESYVTENKLYCVYLAKDEEIVRKHAQISGFPANKINEVKRILDPTAASA